MNVQMFKRMASEGQQISAKFYKDAMYFRDIGHSAASHHARIAAAYSLAARENLFAEIGQNAMEDQS